MAIECMLCLWSILGQVVDFGARLVRRCAGGPRAPKNLGTEPLSFQCGETITLPDISCTPMRCTPVRFLKIFLFSIIVGLAKQAMCKVPWCQQIPDVSKAPSPFSRHTRSPATLPLLSPVTFLSICCPLLILPSHLLSRYSTSGVSIFLVPEKGVTNPLMPSFLSCHPFSPVTLSLLSPFLSCHPFSPVTLSLLSPFLSCHLCSPVTFPLLSPLLPCHLPSPITPPSPVTLFSLSYICPPKLSYVYYYHTWTLGVRNGVY